MGTRQYQRTVTFSRPTGNTTQYAVNDAVSDNATTPTSTSFVIKGVAPGSGLFGKIMSVELYKTDQDLVGADFNIYFFDTQPAAAGWEDNVLIAITDAEWKNCIGFVELIGSTTPPRDAVNVATGDLYCKTNLNLPYKCAAGSTDLYFVMVARGTYTPADGETFTLRVGGEVE